MSIRVALRHLTEYRYDRPVNLCPHVVRLRPAPHCRTPILAYSLKVEPGDHFINWQQDPYSNHLARLAFTTPASALRVEVDLIAELRAINPFDFFVEPYAERYPFDYDAVLAAELGPYLELGDGGPLLVEAVAQENGKGERTVDFLVELNRRLHQRIRYLIRLEPGIQSCEETLKKGSGSCRDSAWLLVQILRRLGIAARFTSGYLIQLEADQKPGDGPRGPESDFTDLHAWAEAYLPGAGWIGLDPTSGLLAGEGHLPLACAADPITAAPITGSFTWSRRSDEPETTRCGEKMSFAMSVSRLQERPRSTRPYDEAEWRAIDACGRAVDGELEAADVRLTVGGEPTFIAAENRDAPEWNTAALGDDKRRLADALLRRLKARFAPGGLLFHGQGKWYPGESLPRWAFGCHWRLDGEPIWRRDDLFAREDQVAARTAEDARRFIAELAERLGLDPAFAFPAYEDVWYYLWRERRLPANVDPLASNLDDPEERRRLGRIFAQGLGAVVGYAMPLRPRTGTDRRQRWETGEWFLRAEHMFLLPGDSPMGFRLPLDSLPWEAAAERDELFERDPLAPRGTLPPRDDRARAGRRQESLPPRAGAPGPPAPLVRTALCVEPRGGILRVFLPPVGLAEDFLDLVASVEATAAAVDMPVMLEGYPPPFDPRLHQFQITPDPGVLEVNVHPSRSWPELADRTSVIYEEARQLGLTAEKFLLDGRPTGTGGGNHLILGGSAPKDSPLLRRPDLLRSLIGYWHNHPSLSYVFSGMFIGPTSQAPRVDEARHDSVYEIELAFRQLNGDAPDGGAVRPWLGDRLFRHLLIDATGNTHRAELCIDKLYSPDSAGGRRGLLELRSFEMPPHERMSLAAQLLVRALVAWFWKAPYRQRLVRWGTQIHDRFLLPHFLEQDLNDVVDDLRRAGHSLQAAWFRPHLEFRFPLIGAVAFNGVHLELRPALEPWPALGEEPGGGGQVRYVDSSVERLQVKVKGLVDGRHVVACKGRRVPLHPTGTAGEHVAGVRFRAWQPPSCLHPMIPVHTPLVFDVIDTWNLRSIGGATYHVSHPGGRAFDTLPVNQLEAEGRWQSRFWPFGHSLGSMCVPPEERQLEFPMTLDLRQPPVSRWEAPTI